MAKDKRDKLGLGKWLEKHSERDWRDNRGYAATTHEAAFWNKGLELQQENEELRRANSELHQRLDELGSALLQSQEEKNAIQKDKDGAYTERAMVLSMAARMAAALDIKVWLAPHRDAEGEDWDDDWRTVVFMDLPTGQVSWHIHRSEVHWFEWMLWGGNTWDGHNFVEKYHRVMEVTVGQFKENQATALGVEQLLQERGQLKERQAIASQEDVAGYYEYWKEEAPRPPAPSLDALLYKLGLEVEELKGQRKRLDRRIDQLSKSVDRRVADLRGHIDEKQDGTRPPEEAQEDLLTHADDADVRTYKRMAYESAMEEPREKG